MSTEAWIAACLGMLVLGPIVGYMVGRWATKEGNDLLAEMWRLRYLYLLQENTALEEEAHALQEQTKLSREIANELLERELRG
jgi:hypothetical protein